MSLRSLWVLDYLVPNCIIFIAISYKILYRETLRHKKRIKTEQISPQELQHFLKENKALKTTVYVFGSLILCFIPSSIYLVSAALESLSLEKSVNYVSFCRLFIMLNSLLNPIIYFWRDKEMRRLVLPFLSRCITVNTSNELLKWFSMKSASRSPRRLYTDIYLSHHSRVNVETVWLFTWLLIEL